MSSSHDLIKPARITRRGVSIGGVELPGAIEDNGITVTPGGHKNLNRLTVTFLVGEVEMTDPTREHWSQ